MIDQAAACRLPHEGKYRSGVAFVRGLYCAPAEAMIPLFDSGFVNCDVVYEKLTVANGRIFRLQDHLERLAQSCAKFRLLNPHTNDEIASIFHKLLRLSGFRYAGLFCCVTRGVEVLDKETDTGKEVRPGNFYASADQYLSITTREQRARGLDLWISKKYIRIAPEAVDPRAKNFHWM